MGSHIWNRRALLGLNVEASLVVGMRDSSPLFAAATDYLARINEIGAGYGYLPFSDRLSSP